MMGTKYFTLSSSSRYYRGQRTSGIRPFSRAGWEST